MIFNVSSIFLPFIFTGFASTMSTAAIGFISIIDYRQKNKWRNCKMIDNTCVMCGHVIPEGRQVCPNCEKIVLNGEVNYRKNKLSTIIKKVLKQFLL